MDSSWEAGFHPSTSSGPSSGGLASGGAGAGGQGGGINIYGPNMSGAVSAAMTGLNQQYGQYTGAYNNYLQGYGQYQNSANAAAAQQAQIAASAAAYANSFRPQSQPNAQGGIGAGMNAGNQSGGPMRLGDVEENWAQFYDQDAAWKQSQGLSLAANQSYAMASKLRGQGNGSSIPYHGAADPNLMVFNPYLSQDYVPGKQSFYPTGASSGAVNNGGGWADGGYEYDQPTITPGLTGAVGGLSNATAYDQFGYGNPYGTYQTGSPAPYADTHSAQFYGYPQPPNNYDSNYTNTRTGDPNAGSYVPYQWNYGGTSPPQSYYVPGLGYNDRPDLYNFPPMATPQSGFSG